MTSYYENEDSYHLYIKRRRETKRNRVCLSDPTDWVPMGDDAGTQHDIYVCLICDDTFVLGAGHPAQMSEPVEDELIGSCEGDGFQLKDVPWWGWGIVIAMVPFAIPVCIVGMTVDAIWDKWKNRKSK